MKKYFLPALLISAVLCTALAVASGGDAGDPLISLSFLQGTFSEAFHKSVDEKLDASDLSLRGQTGEAAAASAFSSAAAFTDVRLDRLDAVRIPTGGSFLVNAGSVQVSFPSGAVIDVTEGTEVSSGSTLAADHRYMVAEDTDALFTVSSKTAAVRYCGSYSLVSGSGTDYTAMADALKQLSLFRGSDTAYGSGYDLETAPTRIQTLIMLLRLLGEEDAALQCTAECPFADMKDPSMSWALPYAAYAYTMGYTNGTGPTTFSPGMTAPATQYVEFLLRALGYSSTENTDVSTSPARAKEAGILTGSELTMLQSDPFLRADVVYLSYYALGARISGSSQTLHERLSAAGVFTTTDYNAAIRLVASPRIG